MWRLIFCLLTLPLLADNPYITFHENEEGKCTGFTKLNGTRVVYSYAGGKNFNTVTKVDHNGSQTLYHYSYGVSNHVENALGYQQKTHLKRCFVYGSYLSYEKVRIGSRQIYSVNYYYAEDSVTIMIPSIGKIVYYLDKIERYDLQGNLLYTVPREEEPYTVAPYEEESIVPVNHTPFSYDSDGRVIEKDGWHFTYDDLDQMITAYNDDTFLEFIYDPLGRRIAKHTYKDEEKIDAEYYVYLGCQEIAALDKNLKLKNLRIPHTPISTKLIVPVAVELDGQLYEPYYDKIGRLMYLDDHEYEITPFGKDLSTTRGAPHCPWIFGFQRTDSETGLTYFGPRYYDSQITQWLTPDPYGDINGPNMHQYCLNDPLNYMDPTGNFVIALPLLWGAGSLAISGSQLLATAFFTYAAYEIHRYNEKRQSNPYYEPNWKDTLVGELIVPFLDDTVIDPNSYPFDLSKPPQGSYIHPFLGIQTSTTMERSKKDKAKLAEKKKNDKSEYKKTKSGCSGKEKADDVPDEVKAMRRLKEETPDEYAKRVMVELRGKNKFKKGPGKEYNKIKKYGQRNFE